MGRACARALSREGWNILGVYFDLAENAGRVESLRQELELTSGHVSFFNKNADNRRARQEILDEIAVLLAGEKLTLFLHSLAFGTLLPFIREESDEETIQKTQMEMTLSVMAHSLVYWTQDLWERELLGGGSKIFAMTSGGSVMYTKSYGAVSAAKCALESHVRQLAVELAPYGVMVNSIRAGITDTPALRKIPEYQDLLRRAEENNPHGRISTPEMIGEALCTLSRMPHSWMTGNVINIDGGEILTI
jgi:enoyl-[acyl-carrier-protein] reductase (NADH)